MKEIYAADWLLQVEPSKESEKMAHQALQREMERQGCTKIVDIRFSIESTQHLHVYRATIK